MNEGVWEVCFFFPACVCLLFMRVSVFVWVPHIKRSVSVHSPRCCFSRVGLFSKLGLLPWCSRKPPDWPQLFLGSAWKRKFSWDCQEVSKRMKKSEKTKLSWTTIWFLARKVRPRLMCFPLSNSESLGLLKFCIPDIINVVMARIQKGPSSRLPRANLKHLKNV